MSIYIKLKYRHVHLKDICLKLILISCDPPFKFNSQFGIPHETPRIPNCGIPKIDVFATPQFGIPSFGIPSFGIPGVNQLWLSLPQFPPFSAIIILNKIVAVIAKVDCRVFCHINSLGDKISNTAAPIQPNPFWFWEKYIYIILQSAQRVEHCRFKHCRLSIS